MLHACIFWTDVGPFENLSERISTAGPQCGSIYGQSIRQYGPCRVGDFVLFGNLHKAKLNDDFQVPMILTFKYWPAV